MHVNNAAVSAMEFAHYVHPHLFSLWYVLAVVSANASLVLSKLSRNGSEVDYIISEKRKGI